MGRPKKKPIADHYEIATFWTSLLRDKDSDLKDRLKVSELLMRFMQEEEEKPQGEEMKGPEEYYRIFNDLLSLFSEENSSLNPHAPLSDREHDVVE